MNLIEGYCFKRAGTKMSRKNGTEGVVESENAW